MMIAVQKLIDKFREALDDDWGYIWGTSGELWTEAKQASATREQTVEYGKKWIGHHVADCSGLFSWAFKQLGGYMYHGSNTMYKSYCTEKGKISDRAALKPGYALFTGTENDHGHVGLYIGDGWVIEASTTQTGVIKSKASAKKWTYWGKLKGVEYSADPKADDENPTLRKGDSGTAVYKLQSILQGLGYDLGKWGVDGEFGSATEKAVKRFQKAAGLTVDGIVGKATWAALEGKQEPNKTYYVKVTNLTEQEAETIADVLRSSGRTVTVMMEGV